MYEKLTRKQANRLEQQTLRVSVITIVGLSIAGIGFGLYIGSEAVMLDGFYALTSLLGSGLYLFAAKVVEKPANRQSGRRSRTARQCGNAQGRGGT